MRTTLCRAPWRVLHLCTVIAKHKFAITQTLKNLFVMQEDITTTMDCAVKVRKHLVRMLNTNFDPKLQEKLDYVNSMIMEINEIQEEVLVSA